MSILQGVWGRFLKQAEPIASSPDTIATEADLYYCYRLLLNREPDEAGWNFWIQQVRRQQHTLRSLTDFFLNNTEFLLQREQTFYSFLVTAARQIQLVALDTFKIYARADDLYIGGAITRGIPYEIHVVRRLRPFLKPGMVFVDIGANIGYFSLMAASIVGSAGRVLAFEPNIDNCELIKLSMRANRFENTTIYPFAVGDREQQALLTITLGSNGIVTPFQGDAPDNTPRQPDHLDQAEPTPKLYLTKTQLVDNALRDVDRIDVIKMDIDGGELSALRGMREIIRRHRPVLFTEFAPTLIEALSGSSAEVYLETLREYGYRLSVIEADGSPHDAVSQTNAEIMNHYFQKQSTHIDLIALPAES